MYKEVVPSKWPSIWSSLIIKSWSTYSEVFLLFWYLVHNKMIQIYLSKSIPLIGNFWGDRKYKTWNFSRAWWLIESHQIPLYFWPLNQFHSWVLELGPRTWHNCLYIQIPSGMWSSFYCYVNQWGDSQHLLLLCSWNHQSIGSKY